MPHQIVDVVEQSIRLCKVAVAEPIEVKVRHRNGVDTLDDGVRLEVSGARGVVEIGGQIDCQVAIPPSQKSTAKKPTAALGKSSRAASRVKLQVTNFQFPAKSEAHNGLHHVSLELRMGVNRPTHG